MILILTVEEFRKYVPIDINSSIDNLIPFIQSAQRDFLKPLLGPDYVEDLLDDYTTAEGNPENMNEDYALLLPFAQKVVANGAAYLGVNHIGVNVGNIGIQVNHGKDSEPAPRWKVDNLQISYLTEADKAAEDLLEWLESYATDLNMFADWLESEYNTLTLGLMVPNVAVASEHIDIAESRRIYLRLKKRIKLIEATTISRLLSPAQYSAIKEELIADTLSEDNEALVNLCIPIIAKKALFETIPFMRVGIQDGALVMYSSTDGVISKSIATKEAISAIQAALKTGDLGFDADIQSLTQFILDNIETYPLIKASGVYTSRAVPGPAYQVDNRSDNKHFSVLFF